MYNLEVRVLELVAVRATVLIPFVDDLSHSDDFAVKIADWHADQGVSLVTRPDVDVLVESIVLHKRDMEDDNLIRALNLNE